MRLVRKIEKHTIREEALRVTVRVAVATFLPEAHYVPTEWCRAFSDASGSLALEQAKGSQ